jgi:hypothetical protein
MDTHCAEPGRAVAGKDINAQSARLAGWTRTAPSRSGSARGGRQPWLWAFVGGAATRGSRAFHPDGAGTDGAATRVHRDLIRTGP